MPETQSYNNHTRYDPLFHFFIVPLLALDLLFNIWQAIRMLPHGYYYGFVGVVMALVFLAIAFKMRIYSLKVQDRVIRLEEQLRLYSLTPPAELPALGTLSASQFVALRFASDVEVAALAQRAALEQLTPQQIKQSIVQWRPDNFRV